MVRYTRAQSIEINKCIHDCNLANYSIEGSLKYIQDRVGVPVSSTTLKDRKRFLRKNGIKTWNEFRNDDYSYRVEFLQRYNDAKRIKESCMQKMLEYENNPKTFFQWKIAAGMVLDASKQMTELLMIFPEIDAIGHANEHLETENSAIPRTSSNSEAIF